MVMYWKMLSSQIPDDFQPKNYDISIKDISIEIIPSKSPEPRTLLYFKGINFDLEPVSLFF
jgi:hypothetical protein